MGDVIRAEEQLRKSLERMVGIIAIGWIVLSGFSLASGPTGYSVASYLESSMMVLAKALILFSLVLGALWIHLARSAR